MRDSSPPAWEQQVFPAVYESLKGEYPQGFEVKDVVAALKARGVQGTEARYLSNQVPPLLKRREEAGELTIIRKENRPLLYVPKSPSPTQEKSPMAKRPPKGGTSADPDQPLIPPDFLKGTAEKEEDVSPAEGSQEPSEEKAPSVTTSSDEGEGFWWEKDEKTRRQARDKVYAYLCCLQEAGMEEKAQSRGLEIPSDRAERESLADQNPTEFDRLLTLGEKLLVEFGLNTERETAHHLLRLLKEAGAGVVERGLTSAGATDKEAEAQAATLRATSISELVRQPRAVSAKWVEFLEGARAQSRPRRQRLELNAPALPARSSDKTATGPQEEVRPLVARIPTQPRVPVATAAAGRGEGKRGEERSAFRPLATGASDLPRRTGSQGGTQASSTKRRSEDPENRPAVKVRVSRSLEAENEKLANQVKQLSSDLQACPCKSQEAHDAALEVATARIQRNLSRARKAAKASSLWWWGTVIVLGVSALLNIVLAIALVNAVSVANEWEEAYSSQSNN